MKTYAVEVTDEAWSSIESQIRYIAVECHSPKNAARWTNRLIKTIADLECMPKRHTRDLMMSKHFKVDIYRMVFQRNYFVFYTIDELREQVVVISFRHASRRRD